MAAKIVSTLTSRNAIITCLRQQIVLSSRTVFVHQKHLRSYSVQETSDPFCPGISEVIDARSPDEYRLDHIPGAVNLPVLYDNQRSEVGKMYKKDSFQARKTGAKLVTQNISEYLENYFHDKPESYSPLIYCWRGGQRSRSLAIILSEVGFPVYVLKGGYKTYRKQVLSDLETFPPRFKFYIISGLTGCGKTYILRKLQEHGEQILDLEGLAKHKGSVLGQYHQEEQPSNKYWQSLLRNQLALFDPARPVWVESESIKIGKLNVPETLFMELCKSKRFCIQLPMNERIKIILKEYDNFTKDIELLKNVLNPLRRFRSNKAIDNWIQLAEKGLWEEFVNVLLRDHYDLEYTHSQKKNNLTDSAENVIMSDFTDNSVNNAIRHLIDRKNIIYEK